MVNEEAIMKKKKKKKRRQSDVAGLDESMNDKIKKKKKKVVKNTEDGVKKKKKKKSLKNSTMIFDPAEPVPDSQENPPVPESDQELFGSQSPAFSPIKSQESPVKSQESPIKSYQSPAEPATPGSQNGLSDDSDAEPEKSPVKVTPVKRTAGSRPSPIIKFAKKTKIVNKNLQLNTEESPKKKVKVGHESDTSVAEDDEAVEPPSEDDELLAPDIKLPPITEEKHVVAPLSDPLISQQEQDLRDLTLLTQVKEKYPDTLVKDINWNNLFVFEMKPDEMASRYEVLLSNIPREKNNCTLVNEALLSFCNSKVRELPLSKRAGRSASQNYNMKKKLNAFSLFSSTFDLKKISREEVKEQWEALDKKEKKRLRTEARALNNIHGIQSGAKAKPIKPRAISAYQIFTKEHMNLGMKMADIGHKWTTLEENLKKEYQTIADESNRERKASVNEQSSPQ